MYGQVDPNLMKEEAEKSFGDNSKFWKVPDAGAVVVFCPPRANERLPYFQTKLHYQVKEYPLLCPKCIGQNCPICMENEVLRTKGKAGDKIAQQLSAAIYAKDFYLYNIIPDVMVNAQSGQPRISYFGKDKEGPTIQPFSVTKEVQKQIMNMFNYNPNLFNPEMSTAVMLTRNTFTTENGKKQSRIYAQPYSQPTRFDDYLLGLLNNIPDLSSVYTAEPESELRNAVDLKLAPYKANSTTVSTYVPPAGTGTFTAPPFTGVSGQKPDPVPNNHPPVPNPAPTASPSPNVVPPSTTAPMPYNPNPSWGGGPVNVPAPAITWQPPVQPNGPGPQAPVTIGGNPPPSTQPPQPQVNRPPNLTGADQLNEFEKNVMGGK